MLFRGLILSLGYLYFERFPPPPLATRADPQALAFFLSWMANSRGWGLLSVKSPGEGTQKEGKCPVHRQHCNIFHWPHSRVVTFKHFNVRFFVSLNIFLCNSGILIKTYVSDHQSLQWNLCVLTSLRGAQGQFSENICSEDDVRSRIYGTFVVKYLCCLHLLGFWNI